jgi:hypothetical protein
MFGFLNLLNFSKSIEVDSREKFIQSIIEEKCVSVDIKILRESVGCTEFDARSGYQEFFIYRAVWIGYICKDKEVVFKKQWKQCTERSGDFVHYIGHFKKIIKEEKRTKKKIEGLVSGIKISFILPANIQFSKEVYEKMQELINK